MGKYQVKCNNAKYDKDHEVLILNCWFYELNQPRIIMFSKNDFCYKFPGNPPPEEEMYKTAKMFEDKRFNIIIDDDPNTEKISYEEFYKKFSKEAEDHLDQVTKDLQDDDKQVMRKLGKLMDEGKLDFHKLIKNEFAIRAKMDN